MGYVGYIEADETVHSVGSTLYGTCDTAAATAAKVVNCPDFSKLVTGVTIHVKFTNSNTSSSAPTLNVNSTGAKNIYIYGTQRAGTLPQTSWYAGAIVSFTYDGTAWMMNDSQQNSAVEQTKATTSGSNMNYPVILGNLGTTSSSHIGKTQYSDKVYANPYTGAFGADTVNGYTLAAACAKAVDTSIAPNSASANLPTSAAVAAFVTSQMGDMAGALVYKGTVTVESSLLNTALSKGWYYIVAMPDGQTTSITIAGESCEAGDMVVVNTAGTYTTSSALAAATDIIQTNTAIITNAEIDTIFAS